MMDGKAEPCHQEKSLWDNKVSSPDNRMQYIFDILSFIYYNTCMNSVTRMNLKLARVEKNLSQQELAELVDVTRQTIGLIEKGDYNPTLKLCIKIARTLNKTLDQLFWEESKNE